MENASFLDHVMFGGNFVWVLIIVCIAFTCMFCSMNMRIMENIHLKFVNFIHTLKYLCAEVKYMLKNKGLGF